MRIPISNAKTLDGIRVRKQNRNQNNVKNPCRVVSIDTETDDGKIFLISDDKGNFLDLDNITYKKVADWLLRYEGSWIFCWNLQYDADCILRLLPEQILRSYRWKKELKFQFGKFKVHYFDKKKLTISKGNHSVSLYDIMQYYDKKKLVDAYVKNIKKSLDPDYLKTKAQRSKFSKYYYSRHKKQIRGYCRDDCNLTKELAEHWIGTFEAVFSFYPANWISSGYLAEKVLMNKGVQIPFFNELSFEIQELARNCFYGGRFELIQRGFIGECHIYDINSAYPYSLTKIPNILNGKWFFSKQIHPKSELGFFFIEASINDSVKICPFIFRKKNGTICYPCGRFKTFVTLEELKMVEDDPKIKYKILESYQFIPKRNCNYPFKKFIETLYYRRLKLKQAKDPLEHAIKIVLNSIYGKTAQRTNRVMGNLFNPVIAASITGYTRAQLYRFMKENNLDNDVVAFATDSIACRRNISNLNSKKLGEMKLDKSGNDVIFLSNGFYKVNGVWKKRGIGFDHERKLEIEHLDTQIDKDGEFFILLETTKTTHIKSGILYNKLHKVGKIEKYWKRINLNSDRKRVWIPAELKSLNDDSFCDSVPIPADIVADLISKEDVDWYYDDEKYEPESEL